MRLNRLIAHWILEITDILMYKIVSFCKRDTKTFQLLIGIEQHDY